MGKLRIIGLVAAIIGAVILGASSFGMGQHDDNKSGTAYQAAAVFTTISSIALVIGLVMMMLPSKPPLAGILPKKADVATGGGWSDWSDSL